MALERQPGEKGRMNLWDMARFLLSFGKLEINHYKGDPKTDDFDLEVDQKPRILNTNHSQIRQKRGEF